MDLDEASAGRPQMQPLKESEGTGDAPPNHWTKNLGLEGFGQLVLGLRPFRLTYP